MIVFPLKERSLIRGCTEHKAAGLGCAADYVADHIPLYSPVDGSVFLFQEAQGGNWIRVTDTEGRVWEMAHLSERYVKTGDHVHAGQLIGKTGNTGTVTTGPHLHLQVFKHLTRLDPVPLLSSAPLPMLIDHAPLENKFIRIGVSPLRYGYVLRGKRYEYPAEVLGVMMALDKQKVLTPVRVEPAIWNQIPASNGLAF